MEFTLKKEKAAAQLVVGGTPRVDLLPNEITQKRKQTKLFKNWGIRVLFAVSVVAIAGLGMLAWQVVTALQLNAVRAEGASLATQIEEKTEIQVLIDTERRLSDYRGQVTATDLSWTSALDRIKSKLPEGAWLCSFTLSAGSTPDGDPLVQIGLAGEIEVCGPFQSAIPYLHDVEAVSGVLSATATSSTWDATAAIYRHSIAVVLDQTIYAGYVAEQQAAAAETETEESSEAEATPEPETGAEQSADTDDTESDASADTAEEGANR